MVKIFTLKMCRTYNVLLLPLMFKIRLHLYLSNSSNRPISDWADNYSNGVAPGVANQITEVAHATPGHSLNTPLIQCQPICSHKFAFLSLL